MSLFLFVGQLAFSQAGNQNLQGVYRGVLPCGDCEGLQETLFLNRGMSFKMQTKYLGKSDSVYSYSGKYSVKQNNLIVLDAKSRQRSEYFVFEKNFLTQSDSTGKKMDAGSAGQFILSKNQYALMEKNWRLIELNGKVVTKDSSVSKEPHVIFKNKDYRINGNGGCNNFFGSYKLEGSEKIVISKMGSTRMACANLKTEEEFLSALQSANTYEVSSSMLALKNADGKIIAKFKSEKIK